MTPAGATVTADCATSFGTESDIVETQGVSASKMDRIISIVFTMKACHLQAQIDNTPTCTLNETPFEV